ncbi:MAG: hypothetical protein MJD61_08505 [Proteobacteria bacterium]|nr:hypothetical protein [Pseudomonadota bacterium]
MPKRHTVTMVELRERAEEIVRAVAAGKSMVLTYRGKPALRLEPLERPSVSEEDPFYSLAELADDDGEALSNEAIEVTRLSTISSMGNRSPRRRLPRPLSGRLSSSASPCAAAEFQPQTVRARGRITRVFR